MAGQPIRSVLVVGGGVASWLTALTLRRRVPALAVTVLEVNDRAASLEDHYAGSRPGLRRLHKAIGIDERALLAATGGAFRLGQRFEGWSTAGPFFQGYDQIGVSIEGEPFHQAWLAAVREASAPPFHAFSIAAALALQGRFDYPGHDPWSPLSHLDYGLSLDADAYAELLRERAIAAGVNRVPAKLRGLDRAGERINAVLLDDGRAIPADLFVDCTGAAALLIGPVAGAGTWVAAESVTHADRVALSRRPQRTPVPPYDRAICQGEAWLLSAPTRRRCLTALFFSSAHLGAEDAFPSFGREPREGLTVLPFHPGRREEPWVANCLALGDAAALIEPLGAPGLQLLASSLDLLVRSLPDSDFAAVELAAYNRRVTADADLLRDHVLLHQWLRRSPADDAEPAGDWLGGMLALFRERGKIALRDGEPAQLDAWLSLLFGYGVRPIHADPLGDRASPKAFAETAAAIRHAIASAVVVAPAHDAVLASIGGD